MNIFISKSQGINITDKFPYFPPPPLPYTPASPSLQSFNPSILFHSLCLMFYVIIDSRQTDRDTQYTVKPIQWFIQTTFRVTINLIRSFQNTFPMWNTCMSFKVLMQDYLYNSARAYLSYWMSLFQHIFTHFTLW